MVSSPLELAHPLTERQRSPNPHGPSGSPHCELRTRPLDSGQTPDLDPQRHNLPDVSHCRPSCRGGRGAARLGLAASASSITSTLACHIPPGCVHGHGHFEPPMTPQAMWNSKSHESSHSRQPWPRCPKTSAGQPDVGLRGFPGARGPGQVPLSGQGS